MFGFILSVITPTTVLVLVTILSLTYYIITMPWMLNMPPGPFPLPILGNFMEMQKDPGKDIHIFQTLAKRYGKLFSLKIGPTYVLVINDYNVLVQAFIKKSEAFGNRPKIMKFLDERLGAGIVTNDGPHWKQIRRTTLMAMRDFGVGKMSVEEKIQEEIREFLDCIGQNSGQPFFAKPLFNLATSNVICGIIFGSRFDYEDATFKELMKVLDQSFAVDAFCNPINFFPFLIHLPYFKQITEEFARTSLLTSEFVKELTASNELTFDPENIRDFVDLFIQMKRENKGDDSFKETSMHRVIIELFTAGTDTTATTLSWAMLYMAKHPDVQSRCQKEIDDVLGKGKQMSLADRDKLPYVEAAILEIMRVRPVVPNGVYHCTSEKTELGGYCIPKDTIVFPNLTTINNDPEIFPDPEQFMPEHFLDGNGKIVHRERMVSFSVGPRSCLGEVLAKMVLSLFFTSILQFYTISPEPDKPVDLSTTLAAALRHLPQNLVFTRRD